MDIAKLKTKFSTGAWLLDSKTYLIKINELIDKLNGVGKINDGSYKIYAALLNQTGNDAPVAKVLINQLGGTVVWTYSNPGSYYANLNNAFTLNKTGVLFGSNGAATNAIINGGPENINQVGLYTFFINGNTLSNNFMTNTYIEIKVYN